MRKKEYDFVTWTSFPSSLKLISDEPRAAWLGIYLDSIAVKPGTIEAQINVKQSKVLYDHGVLVVQGWDESAWKTLDRLYFPLGTFDWTTRTRPITIPVDVSAVRVALAGGGTPIPAEPAETWLDDLKIYQNDVLIYSNDFANWNPFIGAGALGVLAPVSGYLVNKRMIEEQPLIAVGASVLGALIGAGVGYFVPPISLPPLAPAVPREVSLAPKYMLTGR